MLGCSGHANRGIDAITFDQGGDNLRSFRGIQFVHASIMLERLSNVNAKTPQPKNNH